MHKSKLPHTQIQGYTDSRIITAVVGNMVHLGMKLHYKQKSGKQPQPLSSSAYLKALVSLEKV